MTMNASISYFPEADTMSIEVRSWPEGAKGDESLIGGEDAGEDLVIQYAAEASRGCGRSSTPRDILSISPPRSTHCGAGARLRRNEAEAQIARDAEHGFQSMSTDKRITLRLPASLKATAEEAAKADNTTLNQFISVAVAEKVAALKTADCFAARARCADVDAFDRIMNRKGGESPREEDKE